MRYSDEILNQVRENNDIYDVISQYVHLKRSGRNYFGLCPFHSEKSPSFSVSVDKQIFHCFGCGVGGNVITFVSKIEGIGFKEAIENLAQRANISLPKSINSEDTHLEELKAKVIKVNTFTANYYHQRLFKPESKLCQEYVKKRKLTKDTLEVYNLGFSGNFDELYKFLRKEGFQDEEILESGLVNKNSSGSYIDRYRNRFMIPILDVRNRVIAFGGRVLDDSKPKYINSPENVVYSKGKNLFGLNVAKKSDTKKLLIVEGYMDVISLYQRGITNAVASLGTALTTNQGWLLRKNTEQVILGFDADGAGQTAIIRAMEVMQNMGCDMRVLQMDGAKDPDEYIIKYGSARFKKIMSEAISLLEFKVKVLQNELDLNSTGDKLKFLNEIAKLISKIDNTIEKEIYIEKIAKTYNISKEAIFGQVNKLQYFNNNKKNNLEKNKPVLLKKNIKTTNEDNISEEIIKRENTIISILINNPEYYNIIKQSITAQDFKFSLNIEIVKLLFNEIEKDNFNSSLIIDRLEDDQRKNHITAIMAEDYGIVDNKKAIEDIIKKYEREKLEKRRDEIIKQTSMEIDSVTRKKLAEELNSIILELVKMK